MARTLTSQEFNSLVQQLERMAEGIDKHSATGELPARMNAADRRARRQKLEEMRLKYEAAAREAALTYDAYAAYFAECQSELAKDTDVVRGIFGKTNPVVNDFGAKTRTFRSGPAKAAKAMAAKA
jgi:hypothetical protein